MPYIVQQQFDFESKESALDDHDTVLWLHRELLRNRDLRFVCFGHNRKENIPGVGAFYRFLGKLSSPESLDLLHGMFNDLVRSLPLICRVLVNAWPAILLTFLHTQTAGEIARQA